MKKTIKVLVLALCLTTVACSSFKEASHPIVSQQCQVIAKDNVVAPDSEMMKPKSTVITFTQAEITQGINKGTFIKKLTLNNSSWSEDRLKLDYLQGYIKHLEESGTISK